MKWSSFSRSAEGRFRLSRVLAKHFRPDARGSGPSWLARLGTVPNGLWCADLFCCESVLLKNHWVLVVMDQFSRRIVGFAVQVIAIDGTAVCRMFNVSMVGAGAPSHLSTDNAPYFRFHQWCANLCAVTINFHQVKNNWHCPNLRILGIDHLRSVPGAPTSHPFIERLIGTIRREFLDHTLFWNETDLTRKLATFVDYYNRDRAHAGVHGRTPAEAAGAPSPIFADINNYDWKSFCGGLFQLSSAT